MSSSGLTGGSSNKIAIMGKNIQQDLFLQIALQTLEKVNPYKLVLNELKKRVTLRKIGGAHFATLSECSKGGKRILYEKIFVLGAGKGASKMAEATEKYFGA